MTTTATIVFTTYGPRQYGTDVEGLYRQWTGRPLTKMLALNEWLVVARVDGLLVGAAQLLLVEDAVWGVRWGLVENVYVHPDHRGRSIGKGLMHAVESQAMGIGCSFIKLTSRKPDGQALYRALGYEEGVSFYRQLEAV